MKKNVIIVSALFASSFLFSQVGINTETPKATFDVVGKAANAASIDGLIAPRLTGDQLRAKNAVYTTDQKGAIVFVTEADTAPATKTINVTSLGYYYFDGSIWQKLGSGTDINIYKDNGTLISNRTVTLSDKTLSFSSSATTGTNHFEVDGSTFNLDAFNNRVGIGIFNPNATLSVGSPTEGDNVDALSVGIANCGVPCGQGTARNISLYNRNPSNSRFAGIEFIPSILPTGLTGSSITGIDRDGTNNYAGLQFNTRDATGYAARMTIKSSGNVGIGTENPATKLEINNGTTAGAIKIVDGTQGAGKVLTSDGVGLATWQTPSIGSTYTGSTSVALNLGSFQRAALTGDVTAAANSNATTVAAIQGKSVSSTAPINGQVLKYDGSNWTPSADNNNIATSDNGLTKDADNIQLGGALTKPTNISGLTTTNKLAITGTGVDAVNIAGNTVSIDATNNRLGIGTSTPSNKLHVTGTDPLRLEGVQAGLISNDRLLGVTSNGVVKQLGTLASNLSSASIPSPAIFRLNDDLPNFLNGIPTGGVKFITNMTMIKNSIPGLSYDYDTSSITFPPGTYQMTMVYEASSSEAGCSVNSYFIDFPDGFSATRVHSNAAQVAGPAGIGSGSITFATILPSRTWKIQIGRGQAGNCTNGTLFHKYSTQLIIFRLGD